MQSKIVIATTHIDRRNERLTKEALEDLANQINDAGVAIPHTIEHDSTIPPIGKVINAEVEVREDGEYQVVVLQEDFENIEWVKLNDGTHLFKQQSKLDNRPFVSRFKKKQSEYSLHLDWNNFESKQEFQKFIKEVVNESEVDFLPELFGRKSYIPDPEIIINIVKLIGEFIIAKKLLDSSLPKVGDKLGTITSDEIEKLYKFIRTVVTKGAKYLKPENRPVTYIFVVSVNPEIEFVVVTTKADKVVSSVKIENIENTLRDSLEIINQFEATKIQFILDENEEWKLNYLLTKKGEVIGTKKSFSRRAKRLELLENQTRIKYLVEQSVNKLTTKLNKKRKKN